MVVIERAATAAWIGEETVKVDFELSGGKGGVLVDRGGWSTQQEQRTTLQRMGYIWLH